MTDYLNNQYYILKTKNGITHGQRTHDWSNFGLLFHKRESSMSMTISD